MKLHLKTILILTLLLPAAALSQPSFPVDPGEAQVVTADIKNFLEAKSKFSETGDNEGILQTLYFDRASPGLKEYVSRFGLTAAKLNNALTRYPEDYEKLGAFLERIPDFEKVYRTKMAALKEVHPGVMFAPAFLLVADHKGIGQASRVGALVTVETSTGDLEKLGSLATHEMAHIQQAMSLGPQKYQALYSEKDNMLGWALREGAAEFITHYLVNRNPGAFARLNHLKLNETELWEKFQRDLNNQDKTFWLEVNFENNNNGYPFLLGYAIGYRIVEAYYDKAENKEQAMRDILAITDPDAFLEKSGYTPLLTKLQKELRFGTPSPDAPSQVRDYDELIGISDCKSLARGPDGIWGDQQEMTWTYRYILGGTAVQDETVKSDGFHAGSIRQYNPEESSWYVHYYSNKGAPAATLPAWKGERNGNEMRLSRPQKAPNGADGFYKIRFYDISEKGFKWLGGWESADGSVVFENWKIDCNKREF